MRRNVSRAPGRGSLRGGRRTARAGTPRGWCRRRRARSCRGRWRARRGRRCCRSARVSSRARERLALDLVRLGRVAAARFGLAAAGSCALAIASPGGARGSASIQSAVSVARGGVVRRAPRTPRRRSAKPSAVGGRDDAVVPLDAGREGGFGSGSSCRRRRRRAVLAVRRRRPWGGSERGAGRRVCGAGWIGRSRRRGLPLACEVEEPLERVGLGDAEVVAGEDAEAAAVGEQVAEVGLEPGRRRSASRRRRRCRRCGSRSGRSMR